MSPDNGLARACGQDTGAQGSSRWTCSGVYASPPGRRGAEFSNGPKTSHHTPRFLPYGTPGSGDLMDFPPVIRLLHGTVHFRETVVRMDLTSCQEPFKSLRFLQLPTGQEVRDSAGERFGNWKVFLLKCRGLGKSN